MSELEESMQKYMKLIVLAASALGKMQKYSHMVKNIKGENKTVYRDIYYVLLDSQQSKQPVRQFYDQFSKYIKSSYSVPIIVALAQVQTWEILSYWSKMLLCLNSR